MDRAEAVLKDIERLAAQHRPRTFGVFRAELARGDQRFLPIVGPQKGSVLSRAVRERKPKRALEIGTLVGYSAILIARELPPDGKLVSLELDPAAAAAARKNLERAGLADRVEVRVGDAKELIPELEGPFELVFLDAKKEEYLRYLRLAEPLLAPRAVVVADNVKRFAERMADFLAEVRSPRWRSACHEFGDDAVEVSVRVGG